MKFDEALHLIDDEIRKVKIQFDLYFAGVRLRPPNDMREALSKRVQKFQREGGSSSADRFLSSGLVNKFNSFQELWAKGIRTKEEGARRHPLAARAARRNASNGNRGPTREAAPPTAGRRPPAAPSGSGGSASAWRMAPSQNCEASLKGLYGNYLEAKRKAGDQNQPSFEVFSREIRRQTEAFAVKSHCEAVEFTVYSSNNKVTIKAKPGK